MTWSKSSEKRNGPEKLLPRENELFNKIIREYSSHDSAGAQLRGLRSTGSFSALFKDTMTWVHEKNHPKRRSKEKVKFLNLSTEKIPYQNFFQLLKFTSFSFFKISLIAQIFKLLYFQILKFFEFSSFS